MDTPYKWTIDIETDWGGRTDGIEGIIKSVPVLINLFKSMGIKPILFISTELLEDFGVNEHTLNKYMKRILRDSVVSSHGHFHIHYKSSTRLMEDKRLSESILGGWGVKDPYYRPPRFNPLGQNLCLPYSNPKNHLSLLKILWFGMKPNKDTIFYLHPFDITPTRTPAPNLFSKLWYSRPIGAMKLLKRLMKEHPGEHRLP